MGCLRMENEKRLIDANALQFEPDPWGGMNGVITVGRSAGKTMALIQAALKRMIDDAPTVDAVEVVRCKECKFWSDGVAGCTDHVKICTIGYYMVAENGYCCFAERREGK